ncbi:hypothetical protein DPMN_158479 [Dreissena polymorpha]|uniref:Uncharacterized protein n=1 Tax=Dreissena polymorpha TaxID=45954 RepID=A0A9D4EMD8_DREPO|nr:hypothetical protein DPMN_158479 [Dreissena polymorpha]
MPPKVNEYLNNPPTPGSNRGGEGSLPSDLANLGRGCMQVTPTFRQQLMQLLGGMGGPGVLSQPLLSQPLLSQTLLSQTLLSKPLLSKPLLSKPLLSKPLKRV